MNFLEGIVVALFPNVSPGIITFYSGFLYQTLFGFRSIFRKRKHNLYYKKYHQIPDQNPVFSSDIDQLKFAGSIIFKARKI